MTFLGSFFQISFTEDNLLLQVVGLFSRTALSRALGTFWVLLDDIFEDVVPVFQMKDGVGRI